MSYRPTIKTNSAGATSDFPLDAETVKGGTLHKTFNANDNNNFSTDKAVSDYIESKGYITSLNDIYPIGTIYITMGTKSPAELFGGTWTPIENRFLYSTYELNELGQTLGSASHSHLLPIGYEGDNEWFYSDYLTGDGNTRGIRGIHDDYTATTGTVAYRYESSSASSFPPSIKVCAYKRVA